MCRWLLGTRKDLGKLSKRGGDYTTKLGQVVEERFAGVEFVYPKSLKK